VKLASVSDIETFLEKSSVEQQALITLILESVSYHIQDFLNRKLKKDAYTHYFNGGKRFYHLPAYPVDTSQTFTVTVNGSAKTQDSDYYLWDEEGIVEFPTPPSDSKPRIVKIDWTGGYAETNNVIQVPDPIKYACIIQTVHNYRRRRDLGINAISMPNGSMSINERGDLLEQVKALLKPFRRVPTDR